MAPDLAMDALADLDPSSVVLDPMTGSGTVVRHATEIGLTAIGFDMDPLAVLMTRVWTTPVDDGLVERLAAKLLRQVARDGTAQVHVPTIDDDPETRLFVDYWFAGPQQSDLRRLASGIAGLERPGARPATRAAVDVLRVALSRIIITKDQGASLGIDVSHSRPHKVADASDFQVVPAFERSLRHVRRLLLAAPPPGNARIGLGDARSMTQVRNGSVDAVLTSPPYLNAIDYMRGHRLSLVWFGHRLRDLRRIRSDSIGAERGPDGPRPAILFDDIRDAMGGAEGLPPRHASMVARYAEDVYRLMSEVSRVLRPGGQAIMVVGNSCLQGRFIRNSDGVVRAGSMVGLRLSRQSERELPDRRRYLPMPSGGEAPLGKRMRTESILTFAAA